MRRSVTVMATALLLLGFLSPRVIAATASKQSVVASFYPIAYAAEVVGGREVAVTNLTRAGAEPHDLELSPVQMDRMLDADVLFVLGGDFQPAVERAARQRDGITVELLDGLAVAKDHDDERSEDDHEGLDPHVWLDPVLMHDIVLQIQRALVRADPKNRATYAANAEALRAELFALDERYRRGLADCERTLIVTAHESFGYLTRQYGLRQEGVSGIDPTAEPDARRIAELTDLAGRHGVTVVFTEELVSRRVAATLAREAGLRTDTLDPLETLSTKARKAGETYMTVMDSNLRKLRTALGCS